MGFNSGFKGLNTEFEELGWRLLFTMHSDTKIIINIIIIIIIIKKLNIRLSNELTFINCYLNK